MTRVIRIHKLGDPDVLQVDDIKVGDPERGEVRIAVEAIGLNRVESMFRSGGFGVPQLPSKIGYEAAGTIEAVGSGVADFAVGDRVATLPGLSMEEYGTYGEMILYPADMLVRVPANQPMIEAAATWMQYLTAYGLITHGEIGSGDQVVITAASSSVGLAAIQITNAVGATPIAVTRRPEKVNGLLENGAARVIASDEQDVSQSIMEATNGMGASVIFDAVAGNSLPKLFEALTLQGIVVLYGTLSGVEATLPLQTLMLNGQSIRGYAANHVINNPAQRAVAIDFIYAGLKSGTLRPVIDRVFSLQDIAAAHRHLEGNTQIGKIIIEV